MSSKVYNEEEILNLKKSTYEHGSANFVIEKDKCALLVIDMQDEFVKPDLTPFWVPESTKQVPRIKQLCDFCREVGIPVIYTAYAHTHNRLDRPRSLTFMPINNPEIEFTRSSLFQDGKIYDELSPREDEIVIYKPSYGAFYDTPLETILKNLEKDTIIVCGTVTNYCCGMTARQGFERGFKVVFGSDINSSDFQELHEAELKILRRGFARVLTTDEIIEAIKEKK